MARVKRGVTARRRHKKILEMASGYRGRAKSCFRVAIEKVHKGLQYAYRDRKVRKREFRALWIQRLNAALRERGLRYSHFMGAFLKSEIGLNRKMLSEIAIRHPQQFEQIISKVTAHQ
ncbi:50S ribosomal protein L20 [Candidatus Fokinia solitaria]|uniref:Large ribosomal subunit protein bL20 n=1 Tax=Candidatus Fokinia solitaria TaxID=1802984 RepID=A0A2U8BRA2_9RICK|nr:50S ribosomal protein L20 [Candidatus Fokinia solitaria]AWD32859.1 50S ribosomal protein L20 [Candidatus Fokinia solitaria]